MTRVTTINGNDLVSSSRSTINTNFSNLDNAITERGVITIGLSAGADYVCDGTNDGATIQSAINALPSTGGRILVRNGTYNFDASSDRVVLAKTNVIFEGETPGGVIFKATASLFPGGSDANGRYGIFSIGKTQTVKISNIILRNIVFDCNHVLKTAGLTLDGGGSLTNQIGLQNVLVEDVRVTNHGNGTWQTDAIESGLYCISGNTSSYGATKGRLDGITLLRVELDNGIHDGMWLLGEYFTRFKFLHCWIHDFSVNGVQYFSYTAASTSDDWFFFDCKWENNMSSTLVTAGSTVANYRDGSQDGVKNLTFERCYFGPKTNGTGNPFDMTPYWAENLRWFYRSGKWRKENQLLCRHGFWVGNPANLYQPTHNVL